MTREEKIETFIARCRVTQDPDGRWWNTAHDKSLRRFLEGQSDAYLDQGLAENEGRETVPRVPANFDVPSDREPN